MKLFGWLSKLLIGTVLISTLSVLTAWYVVNLYVEEIIRQYQLPGLSKKIQFSDIAARLSDEWSFTKSKDDQAVSSATQKGLDEIQASSASTGPTPSQSPKASPLNTGAAAVPEASSETSPETSPQTSVQASPDSASPAVKEDSIAVWGQVKQESGSKQTGIQKDLVMSTEEFAKKKDLLSDADKMSIFSIVVSKLSQEEVQRISTLMEDGITEEELKEIDLILQKKLQKEEFQKLLGILSKY